MKTNKTLMITRIAVISALSVGLAMLFVIPVPLTKGYINLLEVGIYTSVILFGSVTGGFVGGISGGLLDLLLGYPQWIIFSVIIHGLQGYVAGRLKKRGLFLSLIISAGVMIVGYFFATSLLYGVGAGVASIIGNIWQNLIGGLLSVVVSRLLAQRQAIKQ